MHLKKFPILRKTRCPPQLEDALLALISGQLLTASRSPKLLTASRSR